MRFSEFLTIVEALSPEVQAILTKSKFPVAQDLVAQAIKDLNAELDAEGKVITDKGEAFKLIRQKLGLEKKPVLPEPTDVILKPYYKKLVDKEITLPEYKTAEYFKDARAAELELMMSELRAILADNKADLLFRDSPELVFRGENFSNFKNMGDFSTKLHAINSAIHQPTKGFEGFRDPIVADLKHHGTQIWPPKGAKDNPSKIYIFKGDSYFKCKYFGKGASWCVTKNPTHYYSYRLGPNQQTQYFILDFNKKPDDPARYTNPGVSRMHRGSEFVDLNNYANTRDDEGSFGINGHTSIKNYIDYLAEKGVDNPRELLKADEPTTKEREFAEKAKSTENLSWARSKGKQTVKEFLLYLGATNKHFTQSEFKRLSDDEKYDYMVETGLQPKNPWESEYLRNLSRKDYKEYLGNDTVDFEHPSNDQYHEKTKKLLMAIKSGEELDDELKSHLKSLVLSATSGSSFTYGAGSFWSLMGAGKDGKAPLDLIIKAANDKSVSHPGGFALTNVLARLIVPMLSDKKSPIEAYNFIMSNLKLFEEAQPNFLIKNIARGFAGSDVTGLDIKKNFDKNYSMLLRMLFKNLSNEDKKLVLQLGGYLGGRTLQDNGLWRAVNKNLLDGIMRNMNDIKGLYELAGGKQPWMLSNGDIFMNLKKDDYEWVLKYLGPEAFNKSGPNFSQEYTRKHFKHSEEIYPPAINRYMDSMGLPETLKFLKSDTDFIKRVNKAVKANCQHNWGDCMTLGALLKRAMQEDKVDLLLEYFPRDIVFSPSLLQELIEKSGIFSGGLAKKRPALEFLTELGKQLTDEEFSNLLANKKKYGNGTFEGDAIQAIFELRNWSPRMFQVVSEMLKGADLLNFLEHAPHDYLSELMTYEYLKKADMQQIYALTRNLLSNYYRHQANKDTNVDPSIHKKYDELLDKMMESGRLYQSDIIEDVLRHDAREKMNFAAGTKMSSPIHKRLPVKLLGHILNVFGDNLDVANLINDVYPKLKDISFEDFKHIFEKVKEQVIYMLLHMYMQVNSFFTEEQLVQLIRLADKEGGLKARRLIPILKTFDAGLVNKALDKYMDEENLESVDLGGYKQTKGSNAHR